MNGWLALAGRVPVTVQHQVAPAADALEQIAPALEPPLANRQPIQDDRPFHGAVLGQWQRMVVQHHDDQVVGRRLRQDRLDRVEVRLVEAGHAP